MSCRCSNTHTHKNCGKHERSSQSTSFTFDTQYSIPRNGFHKFVGRSVVGLITQYFFSISSSSSMQRSNESSTIVYLLLWDGFWISAIICSTHKLDMPINANKICIVVAVDLFVHPGDKLLRALSQLYTQVFSGEHMAVKFIGTFNWYIGHVAFVHYLMVMSGLLKWNRFCISIHVRSIAVQQTALF